MAKFDYKKWIVENKHGKSPSHSNYGSLNEQVGFSCPPCTINSSETPIGTFYNDAGGEWYGSSTNFYSLDFIQIQTTCQNQSNFDNESSRSLLALFKSLILLLNSGSSLILS